MHHDSQQPNAAAFTQVAGPTKKPCWPIRGEAMDWAGNVAEGSEGGRLAPSFLSNASFGSVGAGYSAADRAVGST